MSYIAITLIAYLPFQADTPKAPMLWWPEAANGVCANGVHTSYQRGRGLLDSSSLRMKWETPIPSDLFTTGYGLNTYGPLVYDVDLDGTPEVIVAYGRIIPGPTPSLGYLLVLDGRTGAYEWIWTHPNFAVDDMTPAIGYLDNDPNPEIVLFSQNMEVDDMETLRVFCLDGVTRDLEWQRCLLPSSLGPQGHCVVIADANSDGKQDILISIKSDYIPSSFRVVCLRGDDGTIIWQRDTCYSEIPLCWDINGDGIPEVVVRKYNTYGYVALSGLDGSTVWRFSGGNYTFRCPTLADADADGEWEIVTAGSTGYASGVFWINGKTGALEREYVPSKYCNIAMDAITGQMDQDPAQETIAWIMQFYGLTCSDGATALEQWRYQLSPPDTLGRCQGAMADIDNDGENEVVVTSYCRVLGQILYRLSCVGPTGELEWKIDFPGTNCFPAIYPIMADVDADGWLEVILAPRWVYWGPESDTPKIRVIDNEGALPIEEAIRPLRPPTMLALPGRIILILPDPCPVDLSIYDLAGRKVKELYKGQLPAGTHEFELTGLEPGVYVARLSYDGVITTKALVVRR
ncbi:MAG: T9SS type A sorting domain-containing protein [candidate division WOR-3 bacterium]